MDHTNDPRETQSMKGRICTIDGSTVGPFGHGSRERLRRKRSLKKLESAVFRNVNCFILQSDDSFSLFVFLSDLWYDSFSLFIIHCSKCALRTERAMVIPLRCGLK